MLQKNQRNMNQRTAATARRRASPLLSPRGRARHLRALCDRCRASRQKPWMAGEGDRGGDGTAGGDYQERTIAGFVDNVHLAGRRVTVDSVFAGRVEVKLQQLVVFALVVNDGGDGGVDLHSVSIETDLIIVETADRSSVFGRYLHQRLLRRDRRPVQTRAQLKHDSARRRNLKPDRAPETTLFAC
jgi:hypothetical protein